MRGRAWAILVVAAMMTAPTLSTTVGAQDNEDRETDQVTFYGSMFGHGVGSPMPANTIPPIGEDNYGLGTIATCNSAAPATPAIPGVAGPQAEDCQEAGFNKVIFFSSPGPVEVSNQEEFLAEGGYSMLHNERGQTLDIQLDPNGNVNAGVYLTYDSHGWPVSTANTEGTSCAYPHPDNVPCMYPSWGWDPGIYQDVVVTATLYAADLGDFQAMASEPPPIQENIENARVIAEGQWGPDQVINGIPGYPQAHHFEMNLGPPQDDTIQKEEDVFLVFSSYQETNGENYMIDGPVRWYGGEFFPPTFELPVKNAISVERVLPNFVHGQLALVSVVNMPWGSYDVSDENIEFEVTGPDGSAVEFGSENMRTLDIEQSLAHGGHYQPVNKTLIWDYEGDGASPGTYEVTVTATNLQGSSTHSCSSTFALEASEDGLQPGPVEVGLCGEQTLGEGELEDVVEDIEDEADE